MATPAKKSPFPVRRPHEAGYVVGEGVGGWGKCSGKGEDGNFILGPTHVAAPEMSGELRGKTGGDVHDELGGKQDLSGDCAGGGDVVCSRTRAIR